MVMLSCIWIIFPVFNLVLSGPCTGFIYVRLKVSAEAFSVFVIFLFRPVLYEVPLEMLNFLIGHIVSLSYW